MEQVQKPIGVYIRIDPRGNIAAIDSDLFLKETSNWMRIDEGYGDRYAHAQGNYLPGPMCDDFGIPAFRYTPEDGVQERTEAEKLAERASRPPLPPAETEQLQAALLSTQDALAALYELLMGGA